MLYEPKPRRRRRHWISGFLFFLYFVVVLAVIGASIFVAAHFIIKYW